jgi:hypothetical protein
MGIQPFLICYTIQAIVILMSILFSTPGCGSVDCQTLQLKPKAAAIRTQLSGSGAFWFLTTEGWVT